MASRFSVKPAAEAAEEGPTPDLEASPSSPAEVPSNTPDLQPVLPPTPTVTVELESIQPEEVENKTPNLLLNANGVDNVNSPKTPKVTFDIKENTEPDSHAADTGATTDATQINVSESTAMIQKDENENLYLYKHESKRMPKMSSFLTKLADYNTSLQMKKTTDGANLSTLMGVYFPCLQNILGVILFIRMPWLVGQAGVIQSVLIIGTCCLTTFLTAISMSAIATNGAVPAGGSYFMISRSLGPQFGGSVGIIFFLGVSFAASMYIVGAVEILMNYLIPEMAVLENKWNNMRMYGISLLIIMSGIVAVGVKVVNKLATVFLACVIISIVCIWVGILGSLGEQQVCMMSQGNASYLVKEAAKNCTTIPGASVVSGLTKLLNTSNFKSNVGPYYMKTGEVAPGVPASNKDLDVYNDLTTSFTVLLAIFFPSVTGLMAGSNRSGDLKDAQSSIPKGTIGAQLTTTAIYIITAILCGAAAVRQVLIDKYGEGINGALIMSSIAYPHPYIVLFGCLLSTIGAGLQSLIGAPRLLYAIANDDVIPALKFFGVTSSNGEPVRALLATIFIAGIGCAIGNVDLVAPIITMFFLVCYGCVNLACTLQSILKAPNWRPRFTLYSWFTSLLGLIMCLTLMFISNWYYALVALFIAAGIYKYIDYKGAEKEWGDGIRGLQLQAARISLLAVDESSMHVKNWRPQLLALLSYKEELSPDNTSLLSFARSLKHGNGLVIVGTVVPHDLINVINQNVVEDHVRMLSNALKEHKINGFVHVTCEEYIPKGTTQLLQTAGLGGLKPNTILMGWPENWRSKNSYENFSRVVRCSHVLNQSVLVAKGIFPQRKEKLWGFIDIWWVVHDGGMMLLLAHLLKQHKTWRKCQLRIFTVAQLEDDSIKMRNDLKKILYELRIEAIVQVIEMPNQDISAYTYERTINMAERSRMMEKMGLSKRERKRTLSFVLDSAHKPGTSTVSNLPSVPDEHASTGDKEQVEQEPEQEETLGRKPSEPGVRRSQLPHEQLLAMDTCVKLNGLLREHSDSAALVLVNMPPPPPYHGQTSDQNYVEYLDVLTEGLNRSLLVRGSGTEVVTVYS